MHFHHENGLTMDLTIEKSDPDEAEELTRVAIAAKKYWGYPDEWIELWRADLLISPEVIRSRDFYVGRHEQEIVFIYSIRHMGDNEYDLDDCWIAPKYIGKGYGRILFSHLISTLESMGGAKLYILSDPNAEGFYRKMGAVRVGERPSKPEGRRLPVLEYQIN